MDQSAQMYHEAERRKSDNEKYLSWFLSPLKISDNSSFLDVGCGSGYVNNYVGLRYRLRNNCGFDFDIDAVRMARNLETVPGQVSWFCASAENIPLPDHSIDHLVCRVVLPVIHVDRAAAEIGRVMRPLGTVAISLHPWRFYLRWFSWRPRKWKRFVAGIIIVVSSLWLNLTGQHIQARIGRHRVTLSFQTERGMRRILEKHGLYIYHVLREPEFVIYAKSRLA